MLEPNLPGGFVNGLTNRARHLGYDHAEIEIGVGVVRTVCAGTKGPDGGRMHDKTHALGKRVQQRSILSSHQVKDIPHASKKKGRRSFDRRPPKAGP